MPKLLGQTLLELNNPAPEYKADEDYQSDSSNESDTLELSRSHYQKVGKSVLRPVPSHYPGKQVSRKELTAMQTISENSDESQNSSMGSSDEYSSHMESAVDSDEELHSNVSNQSEDDDVDDNTHISDQIASQLAKMEKDSEYMMKTITNSAKLDVEKGEHVRTQVSVWEALLDLRIRLQKSLDIGNCMPQPARFQDVSRGSEMEIESTKTTLMDIIHELVEKKIEIIKQHPDENFGVAAIKKWKRKRTTDADEIFTSISALDTEYQSYRDETIEKWTAKIQGSNGIHITKKFKSINQSITSQIKSTMADPDRLIKRTQLKRSDYDTIGNESLVNESEIPNAVPIVADKYDENIFDDGDYYQIMLKELIESRMADSEDPIQLSMKLAQLKQLQNKKSKKQVDTRASKGRKIRYAVQEKIQNFMAAEPRGTWHQEMINELFSGLFGKSPAFRSQPEIKVCDGFKIMG